MEESDPSKIKTSVNYSFQTGKNTALNKYPYHSRWGWSEGYERRMSSGSESDLDDYNNSIPPKKKRL
jgi:hypothetical protein